MPSRLHNPFHSVVTTNLVIAANPLARLAHARKSAAPPEQAEYPYAHFVIARRASDEAIQPPPFPPPQAGEGLGGGIASLRSRCRNHAALARSAIATSERKMPVAPLRRSFAVS